MRNNISILGNGFLGQNLFLFLNANHHVKQTSMRNYGWKEELNDSDVIINLIGKAHDHRGEATERDFYYANEELVKEIYQVFISTKTKLLIHISSIASLEEEGSPKELSEIDVVNPKSFYGKSKRAAEVFLLSQELPEGKKIIILRPPMVHGPGDKGTLTMLFKVVKYRIPWPLSRFKNKRSFLSIDNFNYIIAEIIKERENLKTDIYHICDDQSLETNEIISLMRKISNRPSFNIYVPKFIVIWIAKFGDIVKLPLNTKRLNKMTFSLVVSNQKIKNVLGIENLPVSADEGLQKTIQSFVK